MEEAKYNVAQANAAIDEAGKLTEDLVVPPRRRRDRRRAGPGRPHGRVAEAAVSVAAALIPFLENDDANRP